MVVKDQKDIDVSIEWDVSQIIQYPYYQSPIDRILHPLKEVLKKADERGGFKDKVFLEYVE